MMPISFTGVNSKSYVGKLKNFSEFSNVAKSTLGTTGMDVAVFSKAPAKVTHKPVAFFYRGASVQLSERSATNSAVDLDILRSLSGYTDESGNVLPYLFVDGLSVYEKGKGTGRKVLGEIIKLAKEKYGGRLLLKPENRDCNPSPFYFKCGMRSSTPEGAREIEEFLTKGVPFRSGYSDPMYLPV